MHLLDLPHSHKIGTTQYQLHLATMIAQGLEDSPDEFHYEPITGAPCSGRLFSRTPRADTVQIPNVQSCAELAKMLMDFLPEARLTAQVFPHTVKGFEVRGTLIENRNCILVWAGWVEVSTTQIAAA